MMTPQPDEKVDFIGIGAGRSGTTWLSECLRQHSDILFPQGTHGGRELDFLSLKEGKELDFFTSENWKDLAWYLKLFPPAQPGKIRGEFSPSYLTDAQAAKRIRQTFPDVKILAILRNPVDKMYSLYWFWKSWHQSDLTFEESIGRGDHLSNGMYFQHLTRYYDLFPRERIHVALYDDIDKDPAEFIRTTYEFLGVRQDFTPNTLKKRINARWKHEPSFIEKTSKTIVAVLRKMGLDAFANRISANPGLNKLLWRSSRRSWEYPPMSAATRERLEEYYRDDVLKLETLIGRDLNSWR